MRCPNCFWGIKSGYFAFTFSRNIPLGLKVTTLLASSITGSPVWGFLPSLADFTLILNFPNLDSRTSSPFSRQVFRICGMLSTAWRACALLRLEADEWTQLMSSAFDEGHTGVSLVHKTGEDLKINPMQERFSKVKANSKKYFLCSSSHVKLTVLRWLFCLILWAVFGDPA